MKTNKELDEVIRNKVKASFVMIKIFYPSENLDLIVLEYDDNFVPANYTIKMDM